MKDTGKLVEFLKSAGKWTLDVTKEIGVSLATEAIKQSTGMKESLFILSMEAKYGVIDPKRKSSRWPCAPDCWRSARPSGSSSALRKGGGVNNRRARSTMTLENSSRRKPQLAAFAPLAACVISEATAFG